MCIYVINYLLRFVKIGGTVCEKKELEKLGKKLKFLRRENTEYYSAASVKEAVDVLIECCEFMLNSSYKNEKCDETR